MAINRRVQMFSVPLIGTLSLIDLITKALARATLPPGLKVEILWGFLILANYNNPGKVLGLFDDYLSIFFSLGVVILIYLIFIHIFSSPSRGLVLAECAIFGGAVGNAVDKLADGAVTDFISVGLPVIRDVAFNLADVFIIAGALAVLPLAFFEIHNRRKPTDEPEDGQTPPPGNPVAGPGNP